MSSRGGGNLFRRARAVTSRALSTTSARRAVGEVHGEREAKAWEKELRKAAGRDARYTREGIAQAARAQVDEPAIGQQADHLGTSPRAVEHTARLNIASIASIPGAQISSRTRDALMASAARGEDTYAYPPISSEGPRNVEWNMWVRGQRVNIPEFEEATRGVVESNNPRRLQGRA